MLITKRLEVDNSKVISVGNGRGDGKEPQY